MYAKIEIQNRKHQKKSGKRNNNGRKTWTLVCGTGKHIKTDKTKGTNSQPKQMMRIYSKKCTIHNASHNDSRKKANNQCNLLKFIIIYNTTIWIAAESINGRILFYHCAIIIELIVIIVVVGVVSVMHTQSMRRI